MLILDSSGITPPAQYVGRTLSLEKRVLDERQPTLNLHDWHVFRFLMVISHLLSNLHWKFRLFLFCQLTALLKYATGQNQEGRDEETVT